MAVAQFDKTVEIGKEDEQRAEEYFKKHNIKYENISLNKGYHDFMTDKLGRVEVKRNYTDAQKYHPGLFFWVETEVGDNQGWWYKTTADHFLFFNGEGSAILIKNDAVFKDFINDLIENGDRYINRFDYKNDERYNRIIQAKCMRCYLEQLENTGVNLIKLAKRSRIS